MNVAVLVKQVPKGDAKMNRVTGLLSRENGVTTNPYDYFALETALRLKDKYGAKVDAFSMAPASCINNFKEYYSLNVDNCYLVSDRAFGGGDVFATSYTLKNALKSIANYDIILCGRQTTDGDTSAVGVEIAEKLDIPSVMYVKEITDITDNTATVVRELTSSIETLTVKLPCVFYIDKDSVTLRIPTLKAKLMASKKQSQIIDINCLEDKDIKNYGSKGSKTKVTKVYEEEPLLRGKVVEGATDKLADFIIEESIKAKRTESK